jgi:signal transduction histidine kinase
MIPRGRWRAVGAAIAVLLLGAVLVWNDTVRYRADARATLQSDVDEHAARLQRALADRLRETATLRRLLELETPEFDPTGAFTETLTDLRKADDAVLGTLIIDDLAVTRIQLPDVLMQYLERSGDSSEGTDGGNDLAQAGIGQGAADWITSLTDSDGVGLVGPIDLGFLRMLLAVQPVGAPAGAATDAVHGRLLVLVLRLDPLLTEAGISWYGDDIAHPGHTFALTGLTGLSESDGTAPIDIVQNETVFGSEDAVSDGASAEVLGPGIEWTLAATSVTGPPLLSPASPVIALLSLLGAVLAVQLVRRRYTERERLETEVAIATRRLAATMAHDRAVFDNAPDGILDVDTVGVVQAGNPAAENLLGVEPGRLAGQRISDLLPGFVVAGPRPDLGPVDVLLSDGRMLEASGATWQSVDGGEAGVTVTLRDVTQERRARDAQARYTEQVEQVAARLEEVNRVRSDLISKISHEIRTPMTTIRGFGELLRTRGDELSPDQRRAAIGALHRHSERLWEIVSDLLTLSESSNGSAQEATRVAVADVVTGIALSLDVDVAVEGRAMALVAPTDLQQIVRSLLLNGAKYGRPPYDVVIASSDADVTIDVRDHGDGIPDDFVQELFVPFSQSSQGDRRTATGLGIGLPLAKTLTERNGGSIQLVSNRQPTIFRVHLPAAPTSEASEPTEPARTADQHHPGSGD